MTKEQKAFCDEISVYLAKYAPSYDIRVISDAIAQGGKESAWGTSELARNANNIFGIKYNAQISDKPAYVKVGSEQNPDGSYVASTMLWCNFDSIESCCHAYFKFLFDRKGVTRYNNLKGVTDYKEYARLIKEDGYATSLTYAQSLIDIIEKNNLTEYDKLLNPSKPNDKNILVAIDAGHGSNTAGKRCPPPTNYREHWANVNMCVVEAEALERCGIPYIKVGWNDANYNNDDDTPLSTRQKLIRDAKCTISVSNHFNASGDGKSYNSGQGIEVLITDKDCLGDSQRLANTIYNSITKGKFQQKLRGVKRQALSMCNNSLMGTSASCLIEFAFMTNENEAINMMQNPEYITEKGELVVKGICEYFGIEYVAPNQKPTPQPTPTPTPTDKDKVPFLVKILDDDLNIRTYPNTILGKVVGQITDHGIYTIVEVGGIGNNWGKLKSGKGWICITNKYVQRL